jgi:hypothetical protein
MLDFRKDMLEISKKYPFIKKVLVSQDAWSEMCVSFDKTLHRSKGTTEKHIKDLNGSMRFEDLFVEKYDEE